MAHTNSSAACPVNGGSTDESLSGDMFPVGTERGVRVSESSRNGFLDTGRCLGIGPVGEEMEGDEARFLKGLLDPKLTVNRGEGCRSEKENDETRLARSY